MAEQHLSEGEATGKPTLRQTAGRWFKRLALVLGVSGMLSVALGPLVLDQLHRPVVRDPLLQAISVSTGVDLSFETASFRPFSAGAGAG